MDDALGHPQVVVLVGGTSEIGRAILRAVATPALRVAVLACRDTDAGERAAAELRDALAGAAPSTTVEVRHHEAGAHDRHAPLLAEIAASHGDIDLVVLAIGVLGDPDVLEADPVATAELFDTNTTAVAALATAAGARLAAQGHGRLVLLSSVAGERIRRANYVYGASKAGMDAFGRGLAEALEPRGVRVLTVRPGFVHSRMTAHLDPAPLATTPEAVGTAVARALPGRRRVIWVPGALRAVMLVLRMLPDPVLRRLPIR